jgi:hypothetical protein
MFLQNLGICLSHDAKNRNFKRTQCFNPFVRLLVGHCVVSASANAARRKRIATEVQSSYIHRNIWTDNINYILWESNSWDREGDGSKKKAWKYVSWNCMEIMSIWGLNPCLLVIGYFILDKLVAFRKLPWRWRQQIELYPRGCSLKKTLRKPHIT